MHCYLIGIQIKKKLIRFEKRIESLNVYKIMLYQQCLNILNELLCRIICT